MEPRISLITLGVADLGRATRFYADCLDLPQPETPPSITFFEPGTTWLALWSRESLAEDAGLAPAGSGFRGFALAHNVRSPAEVDALLTRVAACGGTVTRPGHPTDWGATPVISPIPMVLSGKSRTTPPFRMSERHAARCLHFAARTQSIRCDVIAVEQVGRMRYRMQQDPGQKPTLLPAL